jgi:hypothetical protein
MNVFAILRVKSSVSSPRYQVADDFSKEEILYNLYCFHFSTLRKVEQKFFNFFIFQ